MKNKHYMRLNNEPFLLIKSGSKKIELRLNDEKRKLIKKNDIIEFTNRDTLEVLCTEVIDLHYFKDFCELYKNFDLASLGYKNNEEGSFKDMEKYYSNEEQEKYGVVGIELRVIS